MSGQGEGLLREPVEAVPALVCAVTAALVAAYPEAFLLGAPAAR